MDGRRFRWWGLYGGLLVSAAGCHRDTYHDNFGMPKPGQTVGAIVPAGGGGTSAKKSLWGGGQGAQPPAAAVPGMPAEVAAAPAKKAGQPLKPETDAAMADAQVAAAFSDPPRADRDNLLDNARQGYQRALKKDPKNKAALLGLARMYSRLGDKDRAMEAYQKYLTAYPKDHATVHEVALAHGQWKDWGGAVGWCETALKTDPENRAYRKTMAFCMARAGKWEEAFAVLCQIMPEAQARHNIAGLLDHAGQSHLCRQQLQLALQVDPNFGPAREFLAELDQTPPPGQPGSPVPAAAPNPIVTTGYVQQP